jgi:hypothetical protein
MNPPSRPSSEMGLSLNCNPCPLVVISAISAIEPDWDQPE